MKKRALVLLLGFAGCATDSELLELRRKNNSPAAKHQWKYGMSAEEREAAVARQPAPVRTDLREGTIRLGFTPEQVLLARGKPSRKNRSVGSWGVHEQWVYEYYGATHYLHFEGDKLTSWQD